MRSNHLLHVPVIGQPTGWECGPASLASVLQYFGKPYSVGEVARLAGTKHSGTDHAQLVSAAVQVGATVFEHAGGGRGALRVATELVACGLPVIVGWWSMWAGDTDFAETWTLGERQERDCGHYSVVHGFTPSTLLVMDPQDGTIGCCEWADTEWQRVWYDTDGDAFERVGQWFMALNFDGRCFAERFGAGRDYLPSSSVMVRP